MRVLYVATDLRDADILKQEVRRVSPELTFDICVGLSALRARQDQPSSYDVLLMDCSLPEAEQSQLIHHIRVRQLPLPIVALAAANGGTGPALSAGADDCLVRGPKMADRLVASLRISAERYRSLANTQREHEKLKRSEARLRLIIEALPTGVVLLDQAGKVLAMNATGVEYFGSVSPQDIVGRQFATLIPVEDHPALREFLDKVNAGDEAALQFSSLAYDEAPVAYSLRGLCIQRDQAGQNAVLGVIERLGAAATGSTPEWTADLDLGVAELPSPMLDLDGPPDLAGFAPPARGAEQAARADAAEARAAVIEAELAGAQEALGDAEMRQQRAAARLKAIETELAAAAAERDRLREALSQAEARRQASDDQAAQLAAEQRALQQAADERAAQAEMQRHAADERLALLDTQLREAETRAADAEAAHREAAAHAAEIASHLRAADERAEQTGSGQRAADERAALAEAQRQAAEERAAQAVAQRDAADARAAQFEAHQRAADERAAHAEAQQRAADERAAHAEAQQRNLDERAAQAESRAREATEALHVQQQAALQGLEAGETLAARLASLEEHLRERDALIDAKQAAIGERDTRIADQDAELSTRAARLTDAAAQLESLTGRLAELEAHLRERDASIEAKQSVIGERDARIIEQDAELSARAARLTEAAAQSESAGERHAAFEAQVRARDTRIAELDAELSARAAQIEAKQSAIGERDARIIEQDAELSARAARLAQEAAQAESLAARVAALERALDERAALLEAKQAVIAEKDILITEQVAELATRASRLAEAVTKAESFDSVRAAHERSRAELEAARAELGSMSQALAAQREAHEHMQAALTRKETDALHIERRAQARIAELERDQRATVARMQSLVDSAAKESAASARGLAADPAKRGSERLGRLAAAMAGDLHTAVGTAADAVRALAASTSSGVTSGSGAEAGGYGGGLHGRGGAHGSVVPVNGSVHGAGADRAAVDRALETILRCGELARHLLRLSTRYMSQSTGVDLGHLVRQQESLLRHLAGPDIELHCDLAPRLISSDVDSQDLTHVLTSLIVAARDALPLGGAIRVATASQPVEAPAPPHAHEAGRAERPRPLVLSVSAKGYGIRPVPSTTCEEVTERCGGLLTTLTEPDISWTLMAMLPGGVADEEHVRDEAPANLTRSA